MDLWSSDPNLTPSITQKTTTAPWTWIPPCSSLLLLEGSSELKMWSPNFWVSATAQVFRLSLVLTTEFYWEGTGFQSPRQSRKLTMPLSQQQELNLLLGDKIGIHSRPSGPQCSHLAEAQYPERHLLDCTSTGQAGSQSAAGSTPGPCPVL